MHLVIGGGGTSKPTNALLFPQPRCQVITGVGDFDPAIRRKPSIFVLEDAPWSAFRDRDNPYGFVAFDVDPGQPGGTTSIKATYYAVTGPFGGLTVIDQFTLTKPRGG
ncbi:metallo phosphoesterase [Mycobacterium tuberculosis]|nr:metallo phosphoesterase [Mycobacterium tuberculosis]CKO94497.1 metallo phosphoesterase [Mycobacterium tuberculosis]CMD07784.1 metallo phosphoesterase [Mycobacterium tuberculosis]CML59864.1 metallo phosphoesterase [Mycobacterium tuberculosis]COX72752.1 metallo phosphoesterase [Mycobacterium tuberculosis]